MVQIFIHGLNGRVRATSATTLGELRSLSDVADARLVCCGQDLIGDDSTLHSLPALSTVHVVPRLLGGGKKRKKKVFNKPKKIKHKHKKTKTAVLKFYKMDKDGKVERLRRECPEAQCGPGVFMAAHTDRMYCGRCHLTLVHENEAK